MDSDNKDNKNQKKKIFIKSEEYFGSAENVVFFDSYYEMEGCSFPDLFRRAQVKDDRESLLRDVAAPRATRMYVDLLTAQLAIEKRKEEERRKKEAKRLVDDIIKKFYKKEDK